MFESILKSQSKKIEVMSRTTQEPFVETVFGDDAMRVFYGTPHGVAFTSKFLTHKWLSHLYGAYNDSAVSKSKIRSFVDTLKIDLNECEKPLSEFDSFNDFFARKLKPEVRPVSESPDSIVSPSDGRLLAFDSLNESTLSYVKWAPIRLIELFENNSSLAERFRGGACGVLRLCPSDYHRFHFPVSGRVGITRTISGLLHSVSPYALEQKIPVYCLNKRTVCELDSETFGKVLIMEVGALFVGGIVQSYRAGTAVKKGDEKGYFKFGGSSTLFFFEKNTISFDRDIIENTKRGLETYVKMGESIGRGR